MYLIPTFIIFTFLPDLRASTVPLLHCSEEGGTASPAVNPPPWIFHSFARSSPISEESPKLSLLSFPFSLLAAIYCSAVFGGGMQPVPGKGLLLPGLSRLSLVPGFARDRLSNTNQGLDFSLPASVSLCRQQSSLRWELIQLYNLFSLLLSLELLPWPRSQGTSVLLYSVQSWHVFTKGFVTLVI